ncbi:glycosyltransferase [Parasphingorhabdus cellanae]|uniref:Glycosyltransferase n=1 Tax=Parasphingorhabdus cellanae TaxID=2806553 RepID=A0ABX7SZS8_9SPHN|nr:glycosyltransferase [Parasphingorhabdus cellanae]QTD54803.1 glycosyltransferase [Parasphingorhabdus cellanae]
MNANDDPADRTKIAYLVNQYPTISHTFIRNEILELEEQGFDVTRISVRGWDAELADEADLAERSKTSYLLRGGLWPLVMGFIKMLFSRPGALLSACKLALKMGRASERPMMVHLVYLAEACMLFGKMREAGVTHVHCHFGTNATEVGMLCSALGQTSYSFTVHGPEEFDKAHSLNLREKVKRARFVAAISAFGRSQIFRFAREQDWQKVNIIHCGLGSEFINSTISNPPAAPHLVTVGRFAEQKGQIILIRACHLLAEKDVSFELTMIGDGEMRPQIEREIAQYGLEKSITLVGWKSGAEIREITGTSKALVVPSFAEGLPVVIMEAMAIARPIISTYVAGIPELVRDGSEGFLVYASDAEGLAGAMEQLLQLDDSALIEMGERARERVRERHNAVTEVAKLKELFLAI